MPSVTVLMTTYRNSPEAVIRAVRSILDQTFRDLELVIVLEPDEPVAPILRDTFRDLRLVIVENEERLGRSKSYNLGLRLARGRYLARMDADDYAYPERLERQIAFLRENPQIAVVGSNVRVLDMNGNQVGYRNFPSTHADIVRAFAFINPMMHPTVVWDRDKVGRDLQFDLRFSRFCDDLELWMRLISQGHRFANLPDVHLDYQQMNAHQRPRENWKLNFAARLQHWRLGLRHPRLFLGLALYGVLMLMPDAVIDFVTKRNRISDRFRTLAPNPGLQERESRR